jgi:hypothetical protein
MLKPKMDFGLKKGWGLHCFFDMTFTQITMGAIKTAAHLENASEII